MFKRLGLVASVVILSAGMATAATWQGGGKDNRWHTAGNWDERQLPGSTDLIEFSERTERGPVIDSDVFCGEVKGPAWECDGKQVMDIAGGNNVINGRWRFSNKGSGVGIVNISGGDTLVKGDFRWGDYAYGIVNVSGGAVRCQRVQIGDDGGGEIHISGNGLLDVAGVVNLGGNRGKKKLIVTLNGGMLRAGGRLMCPANNMRTGLTTVDLKAGVIQCASFSHAKVAFAMNIEEGELIIKGNAVAAMTEDVSQGYIKAFGGSQKVIVEYDKAGDRTIVMAAGRKKAWRPAPADRALEVRPDVALKWKPGAGATGQTIYFGTRPDAVKAGVQPVAPILAAAAVFTPKMTFGKTYYWRVDTIAKGGAILPGTVWRFDTNDGKVSAPAPETFAEHVDATTTLKWKSGIAAAAYKVYLGTDAAKVKAGGGLAGTVSKPVFKPKGLKLAETYYWRVDGVNKKWAESPWKGDVWQFTTDRGIARDPKPVAGGQWTKTDTVLKWKAPKSAVAFNVYMGAGPAAVADGAKPVSAGQKGMTFAVKGLREATTYYWRVDAVGKGTLVKGDVWTFGTIGELHLKVDLALPVWENPRSYHAATAKPGWAIWAAPRWADMYMHDPGWFPLAGPADKKGILGSGVVASIRNGGGGNGALHAHGFSRGGLAGDQPPYGMLKGDPIANTYFYACDWAGPKAGDVLLTFDGLPPGSYEVTSYHNFWECTEQASRNRREADNTMPPMPSVTVGPIPAKCPDGYRNWSLKGTGTGVTGVGNVKNVKVTSALSDAKVSKSVVKFTTDGSSVLVTYEAPGVEYKDRARSGREGGRGILNAFEVKMTKWDKK